MDDYLIGVLSNIGVISFVALSAYLLLLTGEISFGQQAFFAIGAYAAGIATALWGWPIAAALALGAASGGGAALLVGIPTLRLHGLYFAIATLAFAEMVRILFELFRYQIPIDGELVGPNGADGFRNIRYIFDNNIDTVQFMLLIYALLGAALLGFMLLERSRTGVVFRMIGEDETLAGLQGVSVARYKVLAAGIAGALAGDRWRTLCAFDHLCGAAHLRRDARRSQPGLRPDRRARHGARPAARRSDRHRLAGVDQGAGGLSHDHFRRARRASADRAAAWLARRTSGAHGSAACRDDYFCAVNPRGRDARRAGGRQ